MSDRKTFFCFQGGGIQSHLIGLGGRDLQERLPNLLERPSLHVVTEDQLRLVLL